MWMNKKPDGQGRPGTDATKLRKRVAAFAAACLVAAAFSAAAMTSSLAEEAADDAAVDEAAAEYVYSTDNSVPGAVDTSGRIGNEMGYTVEGGHRANVAELPGIVGSNITRGAANAEIAQPRIYTDENGFTVQPVPSDDIGFNITYLNADNRGCNSCHALEDVMLNMDTYHGIVIEGYPTEQNFANCFVCHMWATPLCTSVHALHNGNPAFTAMGGSCDSCHIISNEGEFLRWDYEKYNLYKGITDIAADDADAAIAVSYDQTTITPVEDMFYKTIKGYGDFGSENWRTDDSFMDPALYENWLFTVDGDVANPIQMTLPELVEQFGTETCVLKEQCTINGVGNATIYQVEVTGVPLAAILDYVQPLEGANGLTVETEDEYPSVGSRYNIPISDVTADAILVLEVNGQTLPNTQGYPVSLWIPRTCAGSCYKVITGLTAITTDDATATNGVWYGDFEDPSVGTAASKPNSAVLNYPTGVVLEGVAGTPVTLEGFADAWDEPISKVEFSFDHGATWTVMETPDNDPTFWTYWRLTFTPPNVGAYLLDIRTTSIMPDGTERVCAWNTQFLLNVK